ncbi:DUF4031 domain-containing protein [Miniimonas arenae]|uniref:DUF4031 domain-containing protein n=1 Tax=Miniimonas arenae TaxID=676201 RepID=A0A5C5BCI2_9MICO|nr:DUF4031 domain-containing protein [Miniimonas arenae]TNU73606.1 DUF4031 domain-containing protein [Miniimonas arenae]
MTLLLDPPLWPAHGTLWSHLVSDTSLAELHTFAVRAGLPARGFERDHYDVPAERYTDLIALGAQAVTAHELVRALRASGLRRTPRDRARDRAALEARWTALAPAADTRRPRETGTAAVTPPTASSPSGRDVTPGAPEHDAWARVGADLLARWGERGRLYHDTQHLTETLDAVDALAAAEGLDGAAHRRASLAAWFHDAVHRSGLSRGAAARRDGASDGGASSGGVPGGAAPDGAPDSDEAASAALARRTLTALGDPDADEVARLVLLTATHQVEASDAVGAVLCDADLAVLGAAPARYADYAAAIRGEYADVPDREFRAGRSAILTALLSGPLYATGAGSRWWEHRARANVAAEVAALE